ncbi:hypothetical protein D046_4535B, partial [Vibrio parahaemolyticus V-223/04]
QWEKLREAI